jgi:hypothetical protein
VRCAVWAYVGQSARRLLTARGLIAELGDFARRPLTEAAWQAQLRLYHRHRHLTQQGNRSTVVTMAVARELAAFLWAAVTDQPHRQEAAHPPTHTPRWSGRPERRPEDPRISRCDPDSPRESEAAHDHGHCPAVPTRESQGDGRR